MRKANFFSRVAVESLVVCLVFNQLIAKIQSKSICGPLYPRVIGGSTGVTYIYTMDQYEALTVVGGATKESALNGGTRPVN